MPIHDWTRVDVGVFHHFHHSWIEEIKRTLNGGLLPEPYYAMAELHAAGVGPDASTSGSGSAGGLSIDPLGVGLASETEMDFYRRKQNAITVLKEKGDRPVAMVEIVSAANKTNPSALRTFVNRVVKLMGKRLHLLIVDLHPPGWCDPRGIHAAIWEEICVPEIDPTAGKPLTLAAYESSQTVSAYVEPVAVGDMLVGMPLFLRPGVYVPIPLEPTYQAAFQAVPRRWRRVLEAQAP
jgi:hypothetical protein